MWNRANRLTWMFSPVLAEACRTNSAIETSGSRTHAWSMSTTDRKYASILPSTILTARWAGFPLARTSASNARRRCATVSGGSASRVTAIGAAPATCSARYCTSVVEILGASDEVRLAVDLDQHAELAVVMDVALDDALAGGSFPALLRGDRALRAQLGDGQLEIAAHAVEGRFALEDAGARASPELLDVADGQDGHMNILIL